MKINCPKCDHPLADSSIDVGSAIATCLDCRISFHFSKGGKPRPKSKIKQLWRIKVKQKSYEIVVERIWFSVLSILPLLFLTLPLSLFAYMSAGILMNPQDEVVTRLISLGTVIGWLFLAYLSLCLMFNRTRFHISSNEVRISHFPFPWRRSGLKFERKTIEQIFVKLRSKRGTGNFSNSESYFFECLLKSKSGMEIVIDSGLGFAEARSLEFELEKALSIQDSAIKGEFIPTDFKTMLKRISR